MIESGSLVGGRALVEWCASVDGIDAGHPIGPDAGGQLTDTADGVPRTSADGRTFENRLVWERFDRATWNAQPAP